MGWFGWGRRAIPAPSQVAAEQDWRALGNAALAAGKLDEARRCYARGVEAHPRDAALRLNLGYVLLEQGQPADAADSLEQALALRRPEQDLAHDALYLLGRAHAALGRNEQALVQYEAAAKAAPGSGEPLEEGIRLLAQLQRHGEAVEWARRLFDVQPAPATALLLAGQLASARRLAEVLEVLDPLCSADPANVDASVQRFSALLGLGRFDQALAEAERTLTLTGPHPGALANVAAALEKLGRVNEASARLEEALRLEPGHRGALVSRVALLTQQLHLPEALAVARAGLQRYPDDADLHWNVSVVHLLRGEFVNGWREHEWRLRVPGLQHKVLQVDAPAWQGEDLAGRTLLLHGEQGFGDNIQFARFVPEVAAKAGKVILRVDTRLQTLLAALLPPHCRLLAAGAPLPRVDFHAPLMSLPAILQLESDEFTRSMPYLRAEEHAVRAWRERLARLQGPRVGIGWAGNPMHANDHNRSMPFTVFRALTHEACSFVTVQPGLRDEDRAALAERPRAVDAGRELRDFAETAALLQALDLVVTVDTSVAHLAGALGKPVWILLPYVPDWRWMLDREDSPWYPTARLFRQPAPGDWASVLARVRDELRNLAATAPT